MKSHERHARSVSLCLLCCLIFFEFLAARVFIYYLHFYNVIHLTWICKMTLECNQYAFSTLSEVVIQLTFKL
jgi:hypothetical protein